MKEAIGYVTDDGTFFESSEEAEEWESWEALKVGLNEVGSVDLEMFVKVIATIPNEIRRYINANESATRYRTSQASLSAKDNAVREGSDEAIFEQQASFDESLSDVGRCQLEEALRQQRPIDGIGSRGIDAPNVRSSEDMAVGAHTKSAKARLNSSTSHLR